MKTSLSDVQEGDIVFVEIGGHYMRVKAASKTSATRIEAHGRIYRRNDGSPVITGSSWLYPSDTATITKWRRQELEREVRLRMDRVMVATQSTAHLEMLNDVLERIL